MLDGTALIEFVNLRPELRTLLLPVISGHAPLTIGAQKAINSLIRETFEAQHEHPA